LASDKTADNRNTFRPLSPESSVSPPISPPHNLPNLSNLSKLSPQSRAPAETVRPDFGRSSTVTGRTVPPIQPFTSHATLLPAPNPARGTELVPPSNTRRTVPRRAAY